MFRFAAERPIREPQVHAPRGAEHRARGFGFRQALLDATVAAHLAGGQIAQSHAVPQRRMLGNDAAETDLDVVGMRTECEDVYGAGQRSACPREHLVPLVGASLERPQQKPRGQERPGDRMRRTAKGEQVMRIVAVRSDVHEPVGGFSV